MLRINPSILDLEKIRQIVAYQFQLSSEEAHQFIPSNIQIELSKKTKRIRFIYLNEELWGIIRPKDGFFLLTPGSAAAMIKLLPFPRQRVVVQTNVSEYIRKGGNVFAKHILDCDPTLIPYSEVIAVDENDTPLAVGKLLLNKQEMLSFSSGIAVKVRKGIIR
ncbi:MAG: PUA domain-containing protein [Candidatus Helarchaeota archaeon]